ncbi:hypothetical protein TNIN_301661 [Trichonephila inaurata madagascariensis]|uniref:Uncharacterized protein n=1 Tax=Trichonephila inaurata madagascariensis TaxID=2747483 RepID=A0A8X6YTZ6_9ARAC|nr:hypothetical protein TNIN_301661 [Trichonephila inaurata madagascariensis]
MSKVMTSENFQKFREPPLRISNKNDPMPYIRKIKILDLSKLKKKRTAVRSSLTKLINKIEGTINNENEPVDQFEAFLAQLNDKESNLSQLNTLIQDFLSVDTITEDMEASEEKLKRRLYFGKRAFY